MQMTTANATPPRNAPPRNGAASAIRTAGSPRG